MKNRKGWANNEKNLNEILEKACDWWDPFLRHTWKGIDNNSGELEESGKILEKDLWVRAHSKDTPLNDLKERLCQFN